MPADDSQDREDDGDGNRGQNDWSDRESALLRGLIEERAVRTILRRWKTGLLRHQSRFYTASVTSEVQCSE